MTTIKGPITFKQGEIPQKLKEVISQNGIKLPFIAENFVYSNKEIDSWFRINVDGKVYKIQRDKVAEVNDKMVLVKTN